ncbi:hypothetical protein J6590_058631 [Homalodisca vitripennis]|nr:hypothetical protein J6590_058631 [Homalodisca vitripennis]
MTEKEMLNLVQNTDNESDHGSDLDDWYNADELASEDEELIKNTSDKTLGFETDHTALKTNQDYQKLVYTLARLQAQRIKAVEPFACHGDDTSSPKTLAKSARRRSVVAYFILVKIKKHRIIEATTAGGDQPGA